MLTTIAAIVALGLAVAALGLALAVMIQSRDTTTDLRRHRLAHTDAHGYPDPRLDRRQVHIGPPRGTGERRGTRYEPPPERLAPRPEPPSLMLEVDEPLTPERSEQIRDEHRARTADAEPEQLPATGELEAPDLPTTAMPAQQRDMPDVRDIRRRT